MSRPETPVALVTGATGYLGSRLARRLAQLGWDVHALRRRQSPSTALQECTGITLHALVDEATDLAAVMEQARPQIVFHLATYYVAQHSPMDVARLIDSNVRFPALLLDAMQQHGIRRVINAGSIWQCYENRAGSPANLYAATKEAFESLLRFYVEACGFSATSLLFGDIYGPGDHRPKLLNLLRERLNDARPLPMSDGNQYIDPVFVDDAIECLVEAAQRPLSPGLHQRWSVRSEHPLTVRSLVAEFEAVARKKLPVQWGALPARARQILQPIDVIPRFPRSSASVSLASGLERFLSGS